jgi:hypothetical protein
MYPFHRFSDDDTSMDGSCSDASGIEDTDADGVSEGSEEDGWVGGAVMTDSDLALSDDEAPAGGVGCQLMLDLCYHTYMPVCPFCQVGRAVDRDELLTGLQ